MGLERDRTAEELLADTGWLRRLALRLVGDPDVADDLVQDTWVEAVRRSPEARDSRRPWLAKVLRDAFRMRARGGARRAAREQAAPSTAAEVPSPEHLVERAEAQRLLVDLVLRLDEPYRGTVLLHYGEGLSLADIARAQGTPAGTVRRRLKVGLDQLRAWLDVETGNRRAWGAVFVGVPKEVLVAQKTSKLAIGLLLLLLVAVGALLVTHPWRGARRGDATPGAAGTPGTLGAAGGAAGGGGAAAGGKGAAVPPWLAQAGVAPRRIAGRVLTLDGAPVAGATVTLASLATDGGLMEPPRLVTGAAGEFDFGARPAMAFTVSAMAPGKTGTSHGVDLRSPGVSPRPDRLELRLGPCASAMFGTVRDASGGPVAGARVAWLHPGGRGPVDEDLVVAAAVETGADGGYELCIAGGRSFVAGQVSAAGYGAIVVQQAVWGRKRVDFALVPEAIVVGRVLREDSRAPVAGAYVSLGPGAWGMEQTARRAAFSDADGRFRIAGVAPGPHLVEAFGDGLATARETPIRVTAGETSGEVELLLETRAVVRGVVTDGGKPVAGARVVARSSDRRSSGDAVSQPDGSFVLARVPRGPVRFLAHPFDVVSPTTFVVDRPAHDGVVLEVDALGAIVGRVVRGGAPAGDALIELRGPGARGLAPIRSDADGHFAARGLEPGTWIAFASSERDGAFGRAPGELQLERGETAAVTIELDHGAVISGGVVDQDGRPVPTVTVVFQHTGFDDVGIAVTADDGSYRAAMMVGGGAYRPTVRSQTSFSDVLRPAAGRAFPLVTLADGASEVSGVVLAVQLDRLGISGHVVDQDGAPVPDAHVSAARSEPGVEPRFWRWFQQNSTTTDAAGQFTIGDLAAGTYALQARSSAGAEAIAAGVAAGRTDAAIVLPAPGSVEGTLVGFTGTPSVIATRQDSQVASTPVRGTVTGERFAVTSLSPGTYLVAAYTPSQAASARVDVTAGAPARVALTSAGSGTVAGRVRDFHTGAVVAGMRCAVHPRVGVDRTSGSVSDGTSTDRDGTFILSPAPAGEIAVACWAAGSVYTNGLRLLNLAPAERLDVNVPVVRIRQELTMPFGGIGADLDPLALVARLYRVRPGGPAAAAGLRDGDVITIVDGRSVTELSPQGVWFVITNRSPGSSVAVTVGRGGSTLAVELVLGPPDEL